MKDRSKSAAVAKSEAQQLELLTDPNLWGVDVQSLKSDCAQLRTATRSAETRRAWEGDWRHFSEWCAGARRKALPATEETVELYLAHYAGEHKLSTLQRRISSIATMHRLNGEVSPVGSEVRSVLEGLRRRKGNRVRRKAALTPEQLLEISRELDDDSPRGVRDRALLVVGFASGCRRSELAALQFADVRFAREGLVLTIRKSKTDQHAQGREIGIFRGRRADTCPVRTLRAWLQVRGQAAGPLFNRMDRGAIDPKRGITGEAVNEAVQAAVQLIGLDPRAYGAHSLRAGMVTAAAAAGASDSAIMQRSGHKSVQTLTQYIRHADPFRGGDVLREAL
jgi:integrase